MIQKEESNIKRRVYDALNVLIASKIIMKDGKNVIPGKLSSYSGKSF